MKKRYKVGILGCGQIAQIMHLPYLQDSDCFEVYALSDLSVGGMALVGQKYAVPVERQYLDYDAMCADDQVDIILICSKDHYEPVMKATKARKHVFVEKPFGVNRQQGRDMVNSAKENGVLLMVGYMKRYDTGFQYLLEQLKTMEGVNLVRVHDFGGSFAYTRQVFDVSGVADVDPKVFAAGKAATDQAMMVEVGEDYPHLLQAYSLLLGVFSHDLILLRHAFGNDPKVLFTNVTEKGMLTAVLQFGNVQCVLESCLVMDRAIWDENFTVFSKNQNISLEFPWPYLKNAPTNVVVSDNVEGTNMPRQSTVQTSFQEAYRSEWQHLYQCLEEGTQPLTSGEDALNDLELIAKIINAAK